MLSEQHPASNDSLLKRPIFAISFLHASFSRDLNKGKTSVDQHPRTPSDDLGVHARTLQLIQAGDPASPATLATAH